MESASQVYESNYSPFKYGEIVRQNGLFNLDIETGLEEGKL